MKSLPLRTSIFSLVLGMLIMLVFTPIIEAGHEGPDVSEVYHTPEHPGLSDSIGIVIRLQNVSEISSVEIFTCSMEPVFCFYADDMNYFGNNTFESTIEYQHLDFKKGDVLGYNFKIKYVFMINY